MGSTILFLIFLSGIYPIGCAAWANRQTTLLHATIWALAAWLAWSAAVGFGALSKNPEPGFPHYLALGMTGCASIAVLGARRPGVGAWNFVVLGLLAVMVFLWFEGRLAEDDLILYRVRMVFLASTVAIGVLNYLPTRLAPAAVLLAFGCALEILATSRSESLTGRLDSSQPIAHLLLALVPWIGYVRMRWQPVSGSSFDFDQVWLRFRNRFGLFWAQRLREQFNQSAHNAKWPVVLRWQGLRVSPGELPPSPAVRGAMKVNLRALMKRFDSRPEEVNSHGLKTDETRK
jgi:hypothetical protein